MIKVVSHSFKSVKFSINFRHKPEAILCPIEQYDVCSTMLASGKRTKSPALYYISLLLLLLLLQCSMFVDKPIFHNEYRH